MTGAAPAPDKGYWFKSAKFQIEPGEDKETNPGLYGRQLALWLKTRLETCGYAVEDVINEDWGRCLMCQRTPFLLWVGCGSVIEDSSTSSAEANPASTAPIWHCFVVAEVPFWRRFSKRVDSQPAVAKLHAAVGQILADEIEIALTL